MKNNGKQILPVFKIYEFRTCWMKQGPVSKNDAFETFDNTMVCGIINGGTGGGTVTVNPTVPSVSNGIF